MTAPPNCSAHSTSGCHCRAPLRSSRHRLNSAWSPFHPPSGGQTPGRSLDPQCQVPDTGSCSFGRTSRTPRRPSPLTAYSRITSPPPCAPGRGSQLLPSATFKVSWGDGGRPLPPGLGQVSRATPRPTRARRRCSSFTPSHGHRWHPTRDGVRERQQRQGEGALAQR